MEVLVEHCSTEDSYGQMASLWTTLSDGFTGSMLSWIELSTVLMMAVEEPFYVQDFFIPSH